MFWFVFRPNFNYGNGHTFSRTRMRCKHGKSPSVRFLLLLMYFYRCETIGQIWVVDANDEARFEEARSELDVLMKDAKLLKVPMLVLANKSDLLAAKNADEVMSFVFQLVYHHLLCLPSRLLCKYVISNIAHLVCRFRQQ